MVRMDRSTSPTWQSAGTIFMLELCIRWASNFTVGFSSSVSSLYLLARKIMLLISHYRNHGVTNNSTVGIIRVVHIQSSRVLLELYFSAILMMINACCFNRCIHCYTTDFWTWASARMLVMDLGLYHTGPRVGKLPIMWESWYPPLVNAQKGCALGQVFFNMLAFLNTEMVDCESSRIQLALIPVLLLACASMYPNWPEVVSSCLTCGGLGDGRFWRWCPSEWQLQHFISSWMQPSVPGTINACQKVKAFNSGDCVLGIGCCFSWNPDVFPVRPSRLKQSITSFLNHYTSINSYRYSNEITNVVCYSNVITF